MLSLIFLELTLREVLADIPHDAGAILTYALLAVFIGFIWLGSRDGAPRDAALGGTRSEDASRPLAAAAAEGADNR